MFLTVVERVVVLSAIFLVWQDPGLLHAFTREKAILHSGSNLRAAI